ncbi:putative transcription factor C2H2 family [Helianthus annuus]|uniref:RING-type E3 ubiquitin transferase n=2 Tax=Helianthus annuus TaxID=4232 RepID=A0A251TUM7_HELAN|nr:putative transcription factor C2H2 family [Helianthus annuus]KAJ0525836.1 putative transcription factor C2H2 family [Helianthus annuus]KAJ0534103.1 putative transcription factor C2H2 family [Helianthus annuus]KAJ0542235.1 putative transcription factor C2H2 family [Helianthus annuus]KAJ0707283.1 putative transcription factor C2H2 family [Helianthus annuus]
MSSLSKMLFQDELRNSYSRKLLFHTYTVQQSAPMTITPTSSPSSPSLSHHKFDVNVVLVLSVLVCAIICSLVLNSILRCVLRCTRLVGSETIASPQATSARSATGGIKKKAIQTFPVVNYWHGLQLPGLSNECAICLGDFAKGEQIRILPKCNHGYHVRCIDKWLSSHSSCPTCRQSLSGICEKILTGGNYSSTTSSQSEEQSASNTLTISVSPLPHEDFLRN